MLRPKPNPDFAELIGILLGDGSIGIYGKQHRVQVTSDIKEKAYSMHIISLMKRLFDVNPLYRVRKNKDAGEVFVFSKEFLLFLMETGMRLAPKWGRAEIPPPFLSDELDRHVLRGYFDTDGSVVITNNNGIIYPRLEAKISPSPMQKQLIEILKRNKFRVKIQEIGKGKIRFRLNGIHQLKEWYDKVGFSNPRYLKRANLFLNQKTL